MKRLTALLLLLGLLLTGCGQATPTAPETTVPVPSTQAPQPSTEATTQATEEPTLPPRDPTCDLTYQVEGTEESEPATLFLGEGYSLYIPNEGYEMAYDFSDDHTTVTWTAVNNERVQLIITHYVGWTADQVRLTTLALYSRYHWEEDEAGNLMGTHPQQQHHWEMTLLDSGEGILAVSVCYPTEAAEGYGARLKTIAGTLELDPAS